MQSRQADSGVSWCRVALLLLSLCLMNESGSAISFEEFVGYPFNESNGYSVFPRGVDLVQGLLIPLPFPYFGRIFSYANVSDYCYVCVIQRKLQDTYTHCMCTHTVGMLYSCYHDMCQMSKHDTLLLLGNAICDFLMQLLNCLTRYQVIIVFLLSVSKYNAD